MYCGVSIADDVDWQQSKKNEDLIALMEATPDIKFYHGVSRHVEILQMSENSVATMNENLWEILVRGQTNANVAM